MALPERRWRDDHTFDDPILIGLISEQITSLVYARSNHDQA